MALKFWGGRYFGLSSGSANETELSTWPGAQYGERLHGFKTLNDAKK